MRLPIHILALPCSILLTACLYAPQHRSAADDPLNLYIRQRADDFLDIWNIAGGVTSESEFSYLPPTLGILAEAGPLALGGITHNGLTAEVDGRGIYSGPESRTRVGLLIYQGWQQYQDYELGLPGFYKDLRLSRAWHERMRDMNLLNRAFHMDEEIPAKKLIHRDEDFRWGLLPLRRGWQYWETLGIELGLSEPFLTHAGLYARVGFDPSEIFDFLLGLATIDFKCDDLAAMPRTHVIVHEQVEHVEEASERPEPHRQPTHRWPVGRRVLGGES